MHYPILEVSQVEETLRAKMAVSGRNPCQTPGEPIAQRSGGHRKREYCNDLCRQQAFRLRAVQRGKERYELRLLSLEQRLQRYTAETQQRVLFVLDHYGLDAAELQADSIDHEKEQHHQS